MKNRMRFKFMMITVLLIFSKILSAQGDIKTEHDHPKNEIGVANSTVFFINEKVTAYGVHLHYIRNIHDTKFGIGLGYERIFDEHGHNNFGVVGSYNPVEKVTFLFSPGLSYEDGNSSELNLSFHFESTYSFEISSFHLGPVLEFAYDQEDYHVSIGLHIGFGF